MNEDFLEDLEPTEEDIYAMFIQDGEMGDKHGDEIRYMQELAKSIMVLEEHGGFKPYVEQGLEKLATCHGMYLPDKSINLHDMKSYYDMVSKEVERLNNENTSFGINLNKSIEKTDGIDFSKNMEKNDKVKENENDLFEGYDDIKEFLDNYEENQEFLKESREKELAKRGMLNSFEDGVSNNPDFDFDEFD